MSGPGLTNPKVSAEVAAYNEALRVFREIFRDHFSPGTLGLDAEAGKYLENRLLTAFENGWNSCANWLESRTLREIKNDK